MKKRTHITLHAHLMRTEPDAWLVKVADIEEVTPINRHMDLHVKDLPEYYSSHVMRKSSDSSVRVVERVDEIQALIDGNEDIHRAAIGLMNQYHEALEKHGFGGLMIYGPSGHQMVAKVMEWVEDCEEHAVSMLLDGMDMSDEDGKKIWNSIFKCELRNDKYLEGLDPDEARKWTVGRDGGRDLKFTGWEITEVSDRQIDDTRWNEITIWMTTGGSLVIQKIHVSQWEGEAGWVLAEVVDSPLLLFRTLADDNEEDDDLPPTLSSLAKTAMGKVCEKIPALKDYDVQEVK